MSSLSIACLLAMAILVGAAVGAGLRRVTPAAMLDGATRDTVKSGISLMSTLASLALGLILASAKSSYDTLALEVRDAGARVVQLDETLARLGADGRAARERLAGFVAGRLQAIWGADAALGGRRALYRGDSIAEFQGLLRRLPAADDAARETVQRALQLTEELQQIRSLAVAHPESTVLTPLLVVIALWFAAIAVGWNVLAPPNAAVWVVNVVAALSVASAMLLILEMDRPFSGLMRISDAPVRAALTAIQR